MELGFLRTLFIIFGVSATVVFLLHNLSLRLLLGMSSI